MKFCFELKTTTSIEKIWPLYEDVDKWFSWEDDLEAISLNGEFTQNTTGSMTLSGQPPMDFTLVSVVPGKSFTDKTTIPTIGDLYFIHELSEKGQQTFIKHSVEFVPSDRQTNAQDLEFISQIFADVPESVFSLVEAANE